MFFKKIRTDWADVISEAEVVANEALVDIQLNKKLEKPSVCGLVWILVNANTDFGRYLASNRTTGYRRLEANGKYMFKLVTGFGRDYAAQVAYAAAYAASLRKYKVKALIEARVD